MQNKKELTASFRRMLRGRSDRKIKQNYALWFTQMDLSDGKIFNDEQEEQAVQKKLAQQIDGHFSKETLKTRIVKIPSWLKIAAAVILLLAVATYFIPNFSRNDRPAFKLVSTIAGERKLITLSDGSKITLNNSSSIKFPAHFADKDRKVSLSGEAFFDVAHDPHKPFIVSTGKLSIQVLGTSFNIHSYPAEKNIEVTVATGKVAVSVAHQKTSWMLTPGQQLSYQQENGQATKSTVNPNDYTGWQKGALIFKNEPLEMICKRLERWYAVKINIKTTALKNKRISLEQQEESLDNVLKMVGLVADFHYTIKGKEVQIWSQN